jgi:hypothetical protein
MAIELSNLIFTEQDDIVLGSEEEIINTGIANTLAGNDIIIGTKEITTDPPFPNLYFGGILSSNMLNTGDGDDIIIGTISGTVTSNFTNPFDPYHYYGICNRDSIYTGEGSDIIMGINEGDFDFGSPSDPYQPGNFSSAGGIYSGGVTIDTGDGNDIISGISIRGGFGIRNDTTINTGDGNDTITGTSDNVNTFNGSISEGIMNNAYIYTENGDDIITGTGITYGITNNGHIRTENGDDIITGTGTTYGITNNGHIRTENGDDIITGIGTTYGITNNGHIHTEDGDDIINSTGVIYSVGSINTGNGNDSIIANEGLDGSGSAYLGEDEDYIKGFGSINLHGGNDKDTLELTSGNYTVGIGNIWVTFTKGDQLMQTSEFETLIAGGTTYDFTSLTAGQIIVVA